MGQSRLTMRRFAARMMTVTSAKVSEVGEITYKDDEAVGYELYSKMCNATYAIPFMARKYASTPFFTEKYQDAYIRKIDKANRIRSEYNWTTHYEKGLTPDSLRIRFTTCGLCALATRTGHRDILPIMCRTDYTVADAIGTCLHRDKTLATGDPCCDYLYTRPGSDAEKEWQEEHPKGTFNSK